MVFEHGFSDGGGDQAGDEHGEGGFDAAFSGGDVQQIAGGGDGIRSGVGEQSRGQQQTQGDADPGKKYKP